MLSGIPAPAASSSGAPGPGRQTAPCRRSASCSSARCTLRALTPSAIASAELDQASPSASSARIAACSVFGDRRQHDHLACRPRRQHEAPLGGVDLGEAGKLRAKPPDLDPKPRPVRFIGIPCPEGPPNQHIAARHRRASPQPAPARSANSTGRVASGTVARPSCTTLRQASTIRAGESSSASTSSSSNTRSLPRVISRAAGCSSSSATLSTSAVSAGNAGDSAACSARASALRAGFVLRRRIAMPAPASS